MNQFYTLVSWFASLLLELWWLKVDEHERIYQKCEVAFCWWYAVWNIKKLVQHFQYMCSSCLKAQGVLSKTLNVHAWKEVQFRQTWLLCGQKNVSHSLFLERVQCTTVIILLVQGGVLNNQVAVVTVPESQLFAVQQPEQGDSIQQNTDLNNEDDVTSVTPSSSNVTDPNELTINVLPPSTSLPEGSVLAEEASNTAPTGVKVREALSCIIINRVNLISFSNA